MSVRFFKKLSPTTKVMLDNGSSVTFSTVDNLLGYFATDQEYPQQQFEKFMREQRYCISEISQEEFTRDYVEKKTPSGTTSPRWREEMLGSSLLPRIAGEPVALLGGERVQIAVGVKGTDVPRPRPIGTQLAEPAPGNAEPSKKIDFKPTTGTRKPKKK
jgi:hypothetical protein